MDGVLVDSMPYHARAWEVYLSQKGLDSSALNAQMHGKHNDQLLREIFGDDLAIDEIQTMGAEKEALYRQFIGEELNAQLLPGVREFLELHSDARKAVASNAIAANVDFVLDEAGLRKYFEQAVNGEQVSHGKPHPEIYLKVASLLNVSPKECIVFEDSQAGIDAALAAGMKVVAINLHRTTLIGQSIEADHFLDTRLHEWLTSRF